MAIHHTRLLIIGSGPAGYCAAIYAARGNLQPLQLLGMQPGGQLTVTTDVENYPGFAEVIQGPWLMEQMLAQAQNVGTQMIHETITKVDLSKRPFLCESEEGNHYSADTLIIATGAQAKWLGLESEMRYRGYGVSGCATCDGFFYKNEEVAVIGGGNTAVEEALYLTNHARKITLIHRRDQLRAEQILQDRVFKDPRIEIMWNTEVEEVLGQEEPHRRVTGLKLRNTKTQENSLLHVSGVFIAIGHSPSTELFKGQLDLDEQGYIICQNGTTLTNIPGVFAAGDVQDKVYRQAITAAGQGCMAALDAQRYLLEQKS